MNNLITLYVAPLIRAWSGNTSKGIITAILIALPSLSFALDTPRQPSSAQTGPGQIKWSWEAVPGAVLYDVIVNGEFAGQVSKTNFVSKNLSAGEHHMAVKAIDAKWRYSARSDRARRTLSGSGSSSSDSSSGGSSSGSGQSSTGGSNQQVTPNASVSTPRDPRGTEVRPGIMKWEWASVDGADKYEVTVNGVYSAQTSDLYLYNHDLGNGEHSMQVAAVGSDGSLSAKTDVVTQRLIGASHNSTQQSSSSQSQATSDSSSSGTSDSVSAPRDPRGTEVRPGIVKWEWASVSGAASYKVTVNGKNVSSTKDLFLRNNMAIGEHFMTVQAVDKSGKTSKSSGVARVYVNGEASGAEGVIQPPAPQSGDEPAQDNTPVQQDDPEPEPEPQAPVAATNDTGLIDPQTWSQPGINKPNYKLVFSDEFNADRLNKNRWNTQLRWDGSFNGERYEYRTVNGENQFYVNIYSKDKNHLETVVPGNNPFEFNGSRLAIRAKRNPLKKWDANKGYGPLYDMVSQANFMSGAITTYDKFSQKYGYFEARIKIPKQVGTFPAFWLHHQKREWEGTQKTEIDIMENLGHAPHYVYTSFHYFTGVKEGVSGNPHFIKPEPEGQIYTGTNYNEQYHVYAAEWKPGHISYMIDGQVVSQLWNKNVDHEELYAIINLAIGGNWTNYPSNAGGTGREPGNYFPNQNDMDTWSNPALEIDWVRFYKRK